MNRAGTLAVGALAAAVGACVPADEAGRVGSVQFFFSASEPTTVGLDVYDTADGWAISFDRTVLGFKTMTIGKVGVEDRCSYRGRGASADVVFDPRRGLVQTFNGIKPVDCPDVGIIFGPPGPQTTLGFGLESRDLVDLASGLAAHAIVEATAEQAPDYEPLPGETFTPPRVKILLRFDSERTSTRFGGCRTATPGDYPTRGVRVLGGERDFAEVRFAAETLFRDALSTTAPLRVNTFRYADRDADDVVTMDELDALPLRDVVFLGNYRLPNGSIAGSLGDYVRVLFRFAFTFRDERGACTGNEPGAEEGGQPESSP